MPGPLELTRHHALPRRYLGRDIISGREGRGYTAADLFKFYGLVSSLLFLLCYTYTRYLQLFNDIGEKPDGFKVFVMFFSGIPLLLALGAALGFLWWASGALVAYSRWQLAAPRLWRWFWLVTLLFLGTIVLDPLDKIHPTMSQKGLFPAPNLMLLFDGKFETFQFQWGYALLWTLFWFLVAIAHVSYLADAFREVRFYTRRIGRYSASVLTGFRGTLAVAQAAPVTVQYPRERLPLPGLFRGAPRLSCAQLTAEQAAAIVAADASGSIAAAPGQPAVLLVDLGSYSFSPELAGLRDGSGGPLLAFEDIWVSPAASREALVVPLRRPSQ